MILFLEFEGVLHPANNPFCNDTDFSKLQLLEEWLRAHPKVNVVISSSWRLFFKLNELQQLFSIDLQHRVIDKCPTLIFDNEYKYFRYAEILAWIKDTKYQGVWFALDNVLSNYPPNFSHLVNCQTEIGIDANTIQALNKRYVKLNH